MNDLLTLLAEIILIPTAVYLIVNRFKYKITGLMHGLLSIASLIAMCASLTMLALLPAVGFLVMSIIFGASARQCQRETG